MLGYNLLAKPEAYVEAAEGRDGFWRWYGMDEEGNKDMPAAVEGVRVMVIPHARRRLKRARES